MFFFLLVTCNIYIYIIYLYNICQQWVPLHNIKVCSMLILWNFFCIYVLLLPFNYKIVLHFFFFFFFYCYFCSIGMRFLWNFPFFFYHFKIMVTFVTMAQLSLVNLWERKFKKKGILDLKREKQKEKKWWVSVDFLRRKGQKQKKDDWVITYFFQQLNSQILGYFFSPFNPIWQGEKVINLD